MPEGGVFMLRPFNREGPPFESPSSRTRDDVNLLGFVLAQGQMIASNFDLDRITKWRKPDQFNQGPHQQPHLHDSGTILWGDTDLGNGGDGTDRQGGQRLSGGTHGSRHKGFGGDWLDPDRISQLRADSQTDIAHLADDAGLLAKEFDALFLTKTHLPEPAGQFRRCRELLDPARRADANLTQGT